MSAKRLRMRQLRAILSLKHEHGQSNRAIARACGVGAGTVSEYVRRAPVWAGPCPRGWTIGNWRSGCFPRRGPPERPVPCPISPWSIRGTAPARRDAGPAASGVPPAAPGRIPLRPVLRPVPPFRPQALPHDAPGPSGRGEALRGLLRHASPRRRPQDGRGAPGRAVRRCPRGEQLHLRRGCSQPGAPALDWRPRAGA